MKRNRNAILSLAVTGLLSTALFSQQFRPVRDTGTGQDSSLISVRSDVATGSASSPATDLANPATPRVLRFSGALADATVNGTVEMRFTLYNDAQGGSALWSETHQVQVTNGKYSVLLGSSSADGMPVEIFSGDSARWLGVAQTGQDEANRSLLVSVPYALKSVDSERLSGKTFDELLASDAVKQAIAAAVTRAQSKTNDVTSADVSAATANKRLDTQGATKGGTVRASHSGLGQPGVSTQFNDTSAVPVVIVTQAGTGEALDVQSGPGLAINAQSTGSTAIQGVATAASGLTFGVVGYSTSVVGRGVRGEATSLSGGVTVGVQGVSHSSDDGSSGLQGFQDAATGNVYGLQGAVASTGGVAIQGTATAASGQTKGIQATVVSPDGIGIYSETTSTSAGNAVGLWAKTDGPGSIAARFDAGSSSGALFSGFLNGTQVFTVDNKGLLTSTTASIGDAIQGVSTYSGAGLTTAVRGEVHGSDAIGVLGVSMANSNNAPAVYGDAEGADGVALWGESFGGGASTGLIARSFSGSGTGIGGVIGYAQNPAGAAAGARILSLRNGNPYAGGGSQEVEVAYIDVNGNVHAPSFTGSGAGLTSIPGSSITGSVSVNAATATALATNGSNCTAGQYAAGVDASGNAEGCSANGSSFTNLNASNLASGTVPSSVMSGSYGISVTGTAANVTGTVAVPNGGTGVSTLTARAVVVGNGVSGLTTVGPGNNGQVLKGVTGGNPVFGQANLTTDVTGVLPIANGGTGSSAQNFVDLSTTQSVAGAKTFTGSLDASSASNTLPIKAVTVATTPSSCSAMKELIIKTDATAGQQLFICNAAGSGWVLVGDGLGSTSINFNQVTIAANTLNLSKNTCTTAYTGTYPAVVTGEDIPVPPATGSLSSTSTFIVSPVSGNAGSMPTGWDSYVWMGYVDSGNHSFLHICNNTQNNVASTGAITFNVRAVN